MATNLISFPFRIGPNGAVVTQEQGSVDYFGELIAQLVTTIPGERDQAPLFGVSDPTFSGIDAQELVYKIDLFGPPVAITSVMSQPLTASMEDVIVSFTALDPNTSAIDATS